MTNDNFTFRCHSDLQIDRDLPVQPDRYGVLTDSFQRLSQVNTMTIDFVATLLQGLGNVHRGHAAIQRSLLTGFPLELELERSHLLRLPLSRSALLRFLLQ